MPSFVNPLMTTNHEATSNKAVRDNVYSDFSSVSVVDRHILFVSIRSIIDDIFYGFDYFVPLVRPVSSVS